MATKSISQLDTQATANETDLFEVAIVDQNSASGYASKKESAAAIADAIVGSYQYPLRITGTTAKTIAGAINEIKNLVDLLPQFAIEVVQTLPVSDISETTIYLVPASDPEQGNYYEEYIYVNNAWELVGTTAVDLSGYYTSAQTDTLLAAKANSADLATVATSGAYSDLSGKPTIDTALDTTSTNAVENRAVAEAINELSQRIDLLEDVWGLEYDFDNSHAVRLAGAVGRTAGSDFDNFAPWQRRRCIVTDSGVVLAYYGEAGYTETGALTEAITKDGTTYAIGTEVQAMVEQKPVWYKVVPVKVTPNTDSNVGYHGQVMQYYVAGEPKAGFKLHPAFYGEARPIYLSAYEGSYFDTSLNRIFDDDTDTSTTINSGDKLCSIGNNTKPISGLRKTLTKANLETIAQNRGANWHLETIQVNMLNLLLFAIEYASFNSQNEIGAGVTGITDNSSYNCSSLTGSTSSLGNASGRATSTISSIGTTQTTETAANKTSVTYRGVENVWGNIWKHINGINIHGDGSQAGGQLFVNSTLSGFNEQTMSSPYVAVAVTMPKENGYIKYFGFDSAFDWLMIPSKVGGEADSAKPIGDYCYITQNLNGYRIAPSGGGWRNGAFAGASCLYGAFDADYRYRGIGGRLMLIPST
jgi:hypothetical protein